MVEDDDEQDSIRAIVSGVPVAVVYVAMLIAYFFIPSVAHYQGPWEASALDPRDSG